MCSSPDVWCLSGSSAPEYAFFLSDVVSPEPSEILLLLSIVIVVKQRLSGLAGLVLKWVLGHERA
jgi:hypothetical protein